MVALGSPAIPNNCRQRCFGSNAAKCQRVRHRICCQSAPHSTPACQPWGQGHGRAAQQATLGVGLAAAFLCSSSFSPALALQGPIGLTRSIPDRYDLVQPDKRTIGDSVASSMGFVDSNNDGVITKDELRANLPMVRQVTDEATLEYFNDLYDLNMDGTLQTQELLTATAIEACVSEDGVSQALFDVFDKNNDQFVSSTEFKDAIGDVVGQQGDNVMHLIFQKTDSLNDRNGLLDEVEMVEAMNMLRMLLTD